MLMTMMAQAAASLALTAAGPSATPPPCAQGSMAAMETCQSRMLKAANTRLNAAYQTRMRRLSPSARDQLRGEERGWIASRDAKCKVDPTQGTSAYLTAGSCLVTETDARTAQLRASA